MGKIKRLVIICTIVGISLGFTFMEIHWINQSKLDTYVQVIAAKTDIKANTPIQDDQLMTIRLLENDYTSTYFKDKSEIIGSQISIDLEAKTPITKSLILKNLDKASEIKEGHLTAIKLFPEECLAWQIKLGDWVEVVFTDEKTETIEPLGKVWVEGIYDHLTGEDAMPVYLLVRGDRTVVNKIVLKRHLGHLEIIQ